MSKAGTMSPNKPNPDASGRSYLILYLESITFEEY